MKSTRRSENRVMHILRQAKEMAQAYRELTGKPLGVTGEVAEFEAARLLNLRLAEARTPGFDATEIIDGVERKLQIKGRCMLAGGGKSQRIGSIDRTKKFDAVLLVLLNENLDAVEIYEASREAVISALETPGSKSRNERGALPVNKFRAIGRQRWPEALSGPPKREVPTSPSALERPAKLLTPCKKGPRAVTCHVNGVEIGVDAALTLSARKARGTIDFRCLECGQAVRPHREGGGAAHFEHLRRNSECSLSDPERRRGISVGVA